MTDLAFISREVFNVYKKLDIASSQFQQESKIQCLEQCGRCCLNKEVSATPLEMLPMAEKLASEVINDEIDWISLLENSLSSSCIMFSYNSELNKESGKCLQYEYRPTVCRAFGACAVINKNSKKELGLCKYIKENIKNDISTDTVDINKAPVINAWALKVRSIHPDLELSQKEMPINQALLYMLRKILLYSHYTD